MKRLIQPLKLAIVLIAASQFATTPARAGMPVIDVANLTEAIQQVLSWSQQLQGMQQQYSQLRNTYSSLTGPRGMQNLLPLPLAYRNYLPASAAELQSVIDGTSIAYAPLSAQIQVSIQGNAILTASSVSALSPQAQDYLRKSRQAAATLAMLAQQSQANASANFGNIQSLIGALSSTSDTKASADLSGRIQSEQVMTQTNQIKTDALYQGIQAQQLQNAELAREAAIKQLGSQANLTPIVW